MQTQQGEILLEVLQLNLHKACNNDNTAPDVTSVLFSFFSFKCKNTYQEVCLFSVGE